MMEFDPGRRKVVELYKQGLRGPKLARKTHYSVSGVYNVLGKAKELGLIKLDSPGRPRVDRERVKVITERLEKMVVEIERARAVAIGAKCSPRTVYRAWRGE